jgi:hypothetical protein
LGASQLFTKSLFKSVNFVKSGNTGLIQLRLSFGSDVTKVQKSYKFGHTDIFLFFRSWKWTLGHIVQLEAMGEGGLLSLVQAGTKTSLARRFTGS